MKVLSIWQPFASLIIHGHKRFETRSWPCPHYLVGERIGIASTKIIRQAQRGFFESASFLQFYNKTGLPELDELPHGYLLGTALVKHCLQVGEAFIPEDKKEFAFGYWEIGQYAWHMTNLEVFKTPIKVNGKQGLWNYGDDELKTGTNN